MTVKQLKDKIFPMPKEAKVLPGTVKLASCRIDVQAEGVTVAASVELLTKELAAAGIKTCVERGECLRDKLGIPSGTRAELCYAIHAEQNAIIQAAKLGSSIDGATLYCTHQPCVICAKMIVNAGITRVVYEEGYPDDFALSIFEEAGVVVERYTKRDA